jgi:hypothetical protein
VPSFARYVRRNPCRSSCKVSVTADLIYSKTECVDKFWYNPQYKTSFGEKFSSSYRPKERQGEMNRLTSATRQRKKNIVLHKRIRKVLASFHHSPHLREDYCLVSDLCTHSCGEGLRGHTRLVSHLLTASGLFVSISQSELHVRRDRARTRLDGYRSFNRWQKTSVMNLW